MTEKILFCVQQKKESYTLLEQHEGENMNFDFWVNDPFKKL